MTDEEKRKAIYDALAERAATANYLRARIKSTPAVAERLISSLEADGSVAVRHINDKLAGMPVRRVRVIEVAGPYIEQPKLFEEADGQKLDDLVIRVKALGLAVTPNAAALNRNWAATRAKWRAFAERKWKDKVDEALDVVGWLLAGDTSTAQFWAKNVRSVEGLYRKWERLLYEYKNDVKPLATDHSDRPW